MEYAEDEDLRAINLKNHICKHIKAIDKVEHEPLTAVKYVESIELSHVDLDRIISKHIKNFANQKMVMMNSNI
jgi:hypothetical protein